jgi:uncharacterized pyridoxal phosphate-containing UPF0001 family protein
MTTIAVRSRIAAACHASGRAPASVSLLAVSKTFGLDAVQLAHAGGQSAFGENYIQEAVAKIVALRQLSLRVALYRPDPEQQDPPGGRAL